MTNWFRRLGQSLRDHTQTLRIMGQELAEGTRAMRAATRIIRDQRNALEELEQQHGASYAPSSDRPFDAPIYIKDEPFTVQPPKTNKDGN